jgi:hypothetical protein
VEATLTEDEFSQHVNTPFRLLLETPAPVELQLVEVKGYPKKADEHSGMERFSIFFNGPRGLRLEQGTYKLEHAAMGTFDLFLVPIAQNDQGFRYEAVFNYFKE